MHGRRSFHPTPSRMNPLTPYPITPLGSFIGFLLAIIPLPLQFRTWNTAICVYGLWLAVTNFQYFVNFVIWHDNVEIVAPVWCDIGEHPRLVQDNGMSDCLAVTRIQVSCCLGIRACTFVLGLQLFRISRRSIACNASKSEVRCIFVLSYLCLSYSIAVVQILEAKDSYHRVIINTRSTVTGYRAV